MTEIGRLTDRRASKQTNRRKDRMRHAATNANRFVKHQLLVSKREPSERQKSKKRRE